MKGSLEKEMLKEFLIETKELLEKLENDFVSLESNPEDTELINEIFRAVHTIKGGAGMVGNENLQTVAHHMEDILNKIRKGEATIDSGITDPLLSGLDVLNKIADALDKSEDASSIDISIVDSLAEIYDRLKSDSGAKNNELESGKAESDIDEKAARLAAEADQEQSEFEVELFSEDMEELVESFSIETDEILETLDQDLIQLEHTPDDDEILNSIFRGLHTIKGTSSFLGLELITELGHHAEDVLNDLRKKVLDVNTDIMDILLETVDFLKLLMEDVKNKDIVNRDIMPLVSSLMALREDDEDSVQSKETTEETAAPDKDDKKAEAAKSPKRAIIDSTIRVDVERLDSLMNLVSEMVLRRNSLTQLSNRFEKKFSDSDLVEELSSTSGHISYLTTELQFAVMQTRMLPIGKVFNKFSRIVRDLSKDFGKKIDLTIEGAETELDKSLIEEINDPLVHLIRNSVDHGIELPEERKANGKDEVGKVKLYAAQEGNNIIIGIDDDGNGLDVEKLKAKGVERGLISKSDAERMPEKEAFNLIFAPGFSMAEKVTNISGRGVGMDVVKTNITKLNGMIDISSVLGKGTQITIKLPLTLAIIQGLLVDVNEEIFVIPLGSVLETTRVNVKDLSYLNQMEAIQLRNSILPLVRLDRLFNIPSKKKKQPESFLYVVVVGLAENKLGIVVNKMLGQQEVVIKSLGEDLGKTRGVSGATIMGDGRVRMILEIRDLFEMASEKNWSAAAPSNGRADMEEITDLDDKEGLSYGEISDDLEESNKVILSEDSQDQELDKIASPDEETDEVTKVL